MTIPRFRRMIEEWEKHPPVQLLVAAYLGYKPPEKPSNNLQELIELFGSAGGVIKHGE